MESLKINIENVFPFVSKETIFRYEGEIEKHNRALHDKTGKGNDFTGWVNLPSSITAGQTHQIEQIAIELRKKIDLLVVVGIGGSYLGAKAVIEAFSDSFAMLRTGCQKPLVLFAGQNISEDYLFELRQALKEKSYGIVVISKSGTTTEPALAFRILKQDIESKYGKAQAAKRIIAITDKSKGALRKLATEEGYSTFTIPDDIGGRYSVLTPVGLLPIAIAGFDVHQLVEGAKLMEAATSPDVKFENNPSAIYAATRNALYKQGKLIEILVNYNPKMHFFAEWWKQLYGESEGKDHKGIYPASVDFTTDLHSLGQLVQQGQRNLFETLISITEPVNRLCVPHDKANLDNLNYIANMRLSEVNKMAELGTMFAHVDGGVPNIQIELQRLNEFNLGQLIYFFEKACGISGYTLGVNPFDQPGVEHYKRNMFALLGKPGFETETATMQERIKKTM